MTREATALAAPAASAVDWIEICRVDDLYIDRGSAALIGGKQVAVFRLESGEVYGLCQKDPYSGAFVMSRGIVGSRGDAPTVASPMHKQVFDLRTGICLDAMGREPRNLNAWPTMVVAGIVLVARQGAAA